MLSSDGDSPADSGASSFARVRSSLDRLLIIVMAAILVLALAGLWGRYADATRDASRNAQNITQVLAEYLTFRLAAVDGVLARIVATSRQVGGPEASSREWGQVLRNSTSGVPGLSSVVVTDAEGTVLYSTILQIKGVDWSDQPVFRKLKEAHPNQLTAAPPIRITGGDQILIPIGRPLTDPQGEFIGSAIATLVPDHLRDFDEAFDFGQSGVAWVLLPSGDVLFRQISGDASDATIAAERPGFAAEGLPAEDGTALGPLVAGGRNYLTAYRHATTADLVVAVSLAESDFLPTWRYDIVGALAFVAAGAAFLFYTRRKILNALADAEADSGGGAQRPVAAQ